MQARDGNQHPSDSGRESTPMPYVAAAHARPSRAWEGILRPMCFPVTFAMFAKLSSDRRFARSQQENRGRRRILRDEAETSFVLRSRSPGIEWLASWTVRLPTN